MNCNHFQNLVSAYLDGELGGNEMRAMRSHLNLCPDCCAELEIARAVKATMSHAPLAEPPAGFEDRLFAHVLKSEKRTHRFLPITMIGVVAVVAFTITMATVRVQRAQTTTAGVDVSRDEAYIEASDPFSNGLVVNTSYDRH
ncbi:MAG: zf-HC2 domain-containing protein [Fimbriimonadaceae bacterium]